MNFLGFCILLDGDDQMNQVDSVPMTPPCWKHLLKPKRLSITIRRARRWQLEAYSYTPKLTHSCREKKIKSSKHSPRSSSAPQMLGLFAQVLYRASRQGSFHSFPLCSLIAFSLFSSCKLHRLSHLQGPTWVLAVLTSCLHFLICMPARLAYQYFFPHPLPFLASWFLSCF